MISYNELIKHSGNHQLFEASEIGVLSILKEMPFHIHAEGPRGTGKTTILRSVKNILPEIERLKGCEYNCAPGNPHCPAHKGLEKEEIEEIGTEFIQVPFLEISHTAKPATVAGSIDLKKLTDSNNPLAALLPGIIPRAHRGIIFVDEINRLADTSPELADILLDVMGTKPGKIQIEETGLDKVELTVNVSIWAASNPDEDPGSLEDIRRQLSDRFDFSVLVERPREKEVVEKILNNKNFLDTEIGDPADHDLTVKNEIKKLSNTREMGYELDANVEKNLAHIYVNYKLESLRGLKALRLGAVLKSSLKNKRYAELSEIIEVTPLALKHRVDKKTLANIMDYLRRERAEPVKTKTDLSYTNQKNTGANNEQKSKKRKSFIQRLLEKFNISTPSSRHGPKNQTQKNYSKNSNLNNGSASNTNNGSGSSFAGNQGCKNSGNVQMKPGEENIRSPEIDARPISELLDKELVKKGEREE